MAARARADQSPAEAQSLADVDAQRAAQDAAAAAAQDAAAEGASPSEAKRAAREAAEEALANFRLHAEDRTAIAKESAAETIAALREGGAFEPPQAQAPAGIADPAGAPVEAEAAVAEASVSRSTAPPPPPEPPRKLSLAERFAGVGT